ncbi:unnamed protein product [Paramecium octaurelia]|uniref:Uncharacterized protein n=1 Tax=Paramecium octaurelia TaxID=43137 RepID=A0A8S1UBA7_PAROT|nr:unnamed protein product [Paramecium octaurelia]
MVTLDQFNSKQKYEQSFINRLNQTHYELTIWLHLNIRELLMKRNGLKIKSYQSLGEL